METENNFVYHVLDTKFDQLPKKPVDVVKSVTLNILDTTIAGTPTYGCQEVVDLVRGWGEKEEDTVVIHGGRVFYGRIRKTGNKWLRCTYIEAVGPAISSDPDIYAYYQRLRIRKDANAARVATARRLLTIVYRVLSQERLYERREG